MRKTFATFHRTVFEFILTNLISFSILFDIAVHQILCKKCLIKNTTSKVDQPRMCKFYFCQQKNGKNSSITSTVRFSSSLEPDVREKFIQLMTIDLDARRKKRVDGDVFCIMSTEIQNQQRKILLADSSSSSN